VAVAIGAVIWVVALWLVRGGAKRFTRDQLAAKV
jgi:type IV secretory pathway TrbD component